MGNTNLTAVGITRETLDLLHNQSALIKTINTQYKDKFDPGSIAPGDTIDIRLPDKPSYRSGAVMDAKDRTEQKVTFTVAQQGGSDVNFGGKELTLEMSDFSRRILAPRTARIASEMDYLGFTEMYQGCYNQVGTAGTSPNDSQIFLDAGAKMDDNAAPMDDQRFVAITPGTNATMVKALQGLFQDSGAIASQYRMGRMGRGLGFDWARTQNINRHTTGAFAGSTVVDEPSGVTDGDATIDIDTFADSAPTVTKGDIFTIAGVNSVNPETKRDTGNLAQFVVNAPATGSSNQILGISVSPAFNLTGDNQTITALPADGAVVTFDGAASTSFAINMAYHRDALTLATIDLVMPTGDFAHREVMDGVSMRVWKSDDIINDKFPMRIDVLFGWKLVRPELCCRIIGN